MTDDAARLLLARRVWQATAASQAELDAGAKRVERALWASRHRRVKTRRAVSLGSGALVLAAALAYAAYPAANGFWGRDGDEPTVAGLAAPHAEPGASVKRDAPEHSRVSAATPPRPGSTSPFLPVGGGSVGEVTPQPEPGQRHPRPVPRSTRGAQRKAAEDLRQQPGTLESGTELAMDRESRPARKPSWQAVDSALAAGDKPRAERTLRALARSGDVATRAKAQLGLAQLAAERGDCKKVRALVQEITVTGGVPRLLVQRGRRLAVECR